MHDTIVYMILPYYTKVGHGGGIYIILYAIIEGSIVIHYSYYRSYYIYIYIYSRKYTCVLAQDHLGVALRVFIHCARNGKKLQIVRPQRATIGVGLVGILISGNA